MALDLSENWGRLYRKKSMAPNGLANLLLGYPADARLLIVNADDFGMCRSVNEAIFRVLTDGIVRSTTLMVPCSWMLHAMNYLANHPEIPFGVHLTAISEWAHYRWGPVSGREKVPSLVDEAGTFYSFKRMPELLAQVRLDQLEMEFRAQIEVVLAAGLSPTHLDWHCLRIGDRADIYHLMLGLARDYGLALRVAGRSWIHELQRRGLPTSDYDFFDSYSLDTLDRTDSYARLLRALPAGLSEWAVHPGLDTAELRAIEPGGRRIRQTDFDFLMSQQAKAIVEEEGLILLDYRALQAVWQAT